MSTQVSFSSSQRKAAYDLLDPSVKEGYEKRCEQFCEIIYPKLREAILGELENTALHVADVYRDLQEGFQGLLDQRRQLAKSVKIASRKIDAAYHEKWPRLVHKLCLKRAYKEVDSEIASEATRVDALSTPYKNKIQRLIKMHESLVGPAENLVFFQKVESICNTRKRPTAPNQEDKPEAQLLCKKATVHLLRTYQRAGDAYYAEKAAAKEAREKKNSA